MGEATTKNGDRLEVKLLGAPGLRWRGAAIEPATAKDLALLYYLAARPEGAARDELQELLWGVGRRRNLRQALYSLRQLAGADGWLRVGETISLEAGSDLAAFREAVRDRRYGDALELWRTAAAPRGREALLSGFALKRAPAFADWLEVERARLEAHYLDALKCRALELEEEGRYAEALSLTRTLLGEDGLNESAYRAAMRLHYRRGDIEAALSLFETCRRALAEDLGVEPLEETLELVRAIERGRGLESRQEDTPSLLPARGRIPAQLLRPPVLVGREAVWAALDEAWRAGKTIFLCGPAGTGKTRLMLDFVRAQGGFLLSEGRPGDAAVPYSSVARALQRALEGVPLELEDWVRQELARLLPQRFLELSPPRLETADAKHRFMQAIGRVMDGLRAQVSAVAIDDLHHCDGASREVGMMLAARFAQDATPGGARMLIAFRGDELDSAQRSGLGGLVAAGQAVLVALEPLEPAAVKAMLTSLEVPGAAALAARLHRYTGGNPMFVVETLKGMYAGGDFSGTFSSGPPGRVGAVMQGRLGALSATALKLAGAVAVGQAQAETGLLAEVLGLDALTVALALGELEDAQIMAAGRFVHDLWPEMLLATMPAALKTFWHRRTALALEARGETARGETAQGEPARVALHWLAAGEAARAAPFLLRAAGEALRTYADDEAKLRYFQTLWSLGPPGSPGPPGPHSRGCDAEARSSPLGEGAGAPNLTKGRAEALLGLEALAGRTGDQALQEAALAALAALAFEAQDDLLFFRLGLRRAGQRVKLGKPQEAMTLASETLAIARRLSRPDLEAEAALQLGGAAFYAGDLDAAQAAFSQATAADDEGVRLRALNNLGAIAGIRGDLDAAYRYGSEALTLARRGGDLNQIAALLNNLGATADRLARYGEARTSFGEAIGLYERSHDAANRTLALLNLAEIGTRQGAYGPAWQAAAEGLALARSRGLPQLLVRAHLVGGALEKGVGRPEEARERFAQALTAASNAGDRRTQAVARFNLELCRLLLEPAAPAAALEALGELEALALLDVLPWAYAELALLASTPEATRSWSRRITEARDNLHLRLLAALAEQRAALLADPEAGPIAGLASGLEALSVAESPLGYALLARGYPARDPHRVRLLSRAEALLRAQAEGLPEGPRASLFRQTRSWTL